MENFTIAPRGSRASIPARFIGMIADPAENRPRPAPAWLGYSRPSTPEAVALVGALARGDADAAAEIIGENGDMSGHLGHDHADWIESALPDAWDTSHEVRAEGLGSWGRCAVSIRSGIAYVRHGDRVALFSVPAHGCAQ